MAATGAAQLRPKPGLFLWGHFDDNLGGHGRFSSAVRLMGVVPVSLNETPAALNPLLLCPISLWTDLVFTEKRRLTLCSKLSSHLTQQVIRDRTLGRGHTTPDHPYRDDRRTDRRRRCDPAHA